MKRLTDQIEQLDGGERRLAELFAVAEPIRTDPFRKRRILVRLSKQTLRRRFAGRRAIIVTLMLGVTSAAATVGRGPIKAAWNELWPWHQIGKEVSELQSPQHPLNVVKPQMTETIALPITPAEPPQPAAVQQAAASTVTARPHSTTEPRHAANSEDPSQVVSAIRALRNEHDPVRAKTLLNRYLQTHPEGALTEDALALSIEAAAASNDPKRSEFARMYLAKYPNGRYRTLALKALGQ